MKRSVKSLLVFILIISLFTGCISTNFIGETFPETDNLQIFFSAREISDDFTVFGHIVTSTSNSLFISVEDLNLNWLRKQRREEMTG